MIVLGSTTTALGVIRVLGRAGVGTFVLAAERDYVSKSRWYQPLPTSIGGANATRDLAAYLDALDVPRAVLMPCSDFWLDAVAALPKSTSERFPSSISAPETLRALVDKGCFEETLTSAGLPHPRTTIVKSVVDLDALPDSAFAGAFLKPRQSQPFHTHYGVKAFRVRDRAEAVSLFREVTSRGFAVVLQEYIPGPPTLHYFIDGFVDLQGRTRACFARHRLRMYPLDFGNSTYMVSVPIGEVEPAMRTLESLFARLRYRGIFSAEFKRDERDGEFKILEMNARPWWYVEFAAQCGVDVCSLAYGDALGEPIPSIDRYASGRTCVYPYFDFAACRRLYREGRIGLLSWAWSWLRSKQPVFEWSDPLPAMSATATLLKKSLRRRFARARRVPAGVPETARL